MNLNFTTSMREDRCISLNNLSFFKKTILEKVELQMGRKLTEDELRVFHISSRIGLVKGCVYGRDGVIR